MSTFFPLRIAPISEVMNSFESSPYSNEAKYFMLFDVCLSQMFFVCLFFSYAFYAHAYCERYTYVFEL